MKLRCSVVAILILSIQRSKEDCKFRHSNNYYGFECHNTSMSKICSKSFGSFQSILFSKIERYEVFNTSTVNITSEVLSSFKMISYLTINNGNIKTIEIGALNQLSNLTQLSLKNNKIHTLCVPCFSNLSKLTEFDISVNRIENIDDEVFGLFSQLKKVNISYNLLKKLPKNFLITLTALESLDLSHNKINKLDNRVFQNLKNLLLLDLSFNSLTNISENLLINNGALKNLSFNNNQLENFKLEGRFQIDVLDLSNNFIILSNDSFKCFNIKHLYLDNNFIGQSRNIGTLFLLKLTNLSSLSLSGNQITALPENVFKNIIQLKKLNVASNKLHNFNCLSARVTSLNASHNFLNSSITLTHLTKLQSLDLSYNNFSSIHFNFLKNLKKLTFLKFQNCNIRELKIGCFRELRLLENLDLSHNKITTFKIGTFTGVESLLSLDISYNKLITINSIVFYNLLKIKYINFAYNNLSVLSIENTLSHMSWLKEINLAGNQFSCKTLIKITKHFKNVKIGGSIAFNVTNVEGIACQSRLINESYYSNYFSKVDYDFLNKIKTKQPIANHLLIFLIILVTIKCLLKNYTTCLGKLIIKKPNEQEK